MRIAKCNENAVGIVKCSINNKQSTLINTRPVNKTQLRQEEMRRGEEKREEMHSSNT